MEGERETMIPGPASDARGARKRERRVVVAMSGGVDSSVAAALFAERGFDVVGITLQLYDHGAALGRKGACCAGQDIHDARQVAQAIGIPHYVLDYQQRFRDSVVEPFIDSYLAGQTPIPCALCNQTVKFRDLVRTARDLGADALATGHYVRRVDGPRGWELHRAADATRDQSYFLYGTTPAQLDFLRFPLGELDKEATRALAARFALPVAAKPDSQDICFVPTGRYADVIERLRPGAAVAGDIVDLDGRMLGRHGGIARFTVGQRRGLGLGGGEALYVIRLDTERHQVVVGPKQALGSTRFVLGAVNWLAPEARAAAAAAAGVQVAAKVRSTQAAQPATVFTRGADQDVAEVVLAQPERAIAPGQACVLYAGDRLLGGGWIARTDRHAPSRRAPERRGEVA